MGYRIVNDDVSEAVLMLDQSRPKLLFRTALKRQCLKYSTSKYMLGYCM